MAKRNLAKKFALNYLVMGGTGLPNVCINAGTQLLLDVGFHWSGAMAVLAYFFGLGLSMTYSNFWAMFTRSTFVFLGHEYSFSHEKRPEGPKR